jgi:ABC transporter substrate binding protein
MLRESIGRPLNSPLRQVSRGLVASLNRPGGNATGMTLLTANLEAKRLEFLHQMVSKAAAIDLLVNPANPNADAQTREAREAARTYGLELRVFNAGGEHDLDAAFKAFAEPSAEALLFASDAVFLSCRPVSLFGTVPISATQHDLLYQIVPRSIPPYAQLAIMRLRLSVRASAAPQRPRILDVRDRAARSYRCQHEHGLPERLAAESSGPVRQNGHNDLRSRGVTRATQTIVRQKHNVREE